MGVGPLGELVYDIAIWIVPLVIAIVFHEVAHGLVADMLGDSTARRAGRLSFNPVAHVDPVGTVGLPLVLAVAGAPVFGWAKPVPVRTDRLRNPRLDSILVSLAGPGMNLFLGVLAVGGLLIVGIDAMQPDADPVRGFLAANLFNFLLINVFLAVFNMIPLPPFDGGHVLEGLLPRKAAAEYAKLAPFGFPILFVLIVVLPALSPSLDVVRAVVTPVVRAVTHFLLWSAGLTL